MVRGVGVVVLVAVIRISSIVVGPTASLAYIVVVIAPSVHVGQVEGEDGVVVAAGAVVGVPVVRMKWSQCPRIQAQGDAGEEDPLHVVVVLMVIGIVVL
jgi:hypothetical protein